MEEALVSDTLNLTGAAHHPTQRRLRHELHAGLRRAFAVGRASARPPMGRSNGRGARASTLEHSGTGSRRGVRHEPRARATAREPDARTNELSGCMYALPRDRRTLRAAATDPTRPTAGAAARPDGADLEGGPCLAPEEVAALADLETEHNWRHGFQPLDLAEQVRSIDDGGARGNGEAPLPRARIDALFAAYSRQWAPGELRGGQLATSVTRRQ